MFCLIYGLISSVHYTYRVTASEDLPNSTNDIAKMATLYKQNCTTQKMEADEILKVASMTTST